MTSWFKGPRKWKENQSSLVRRGKKVAHSTDKVCPKSYPLGFKCPLSDEVIKTLSLAALPEDILGLIFSNITYLDRFRLKMAGNHRLVSIISGLPKPDFKTYVSQLEKNPSRTLPDAEGIEKAFYLACETGYEALFLKLLSQKNPNANRYKEACMMVGCLVAAIYSQQKHMLQRILKCLDSTPRALFSAVQSPKHQRQIMKYKRAHIAEGALEFAAMTNRLWAVQVLLKYGAKASSKQGVAGLYKAVERGHQEVVAMLSKRITWDTRNILSKALPGAVRGGHNGIIQILLARGAVLSHDPNFRGFLHRAAEYGHNSTIKFLLPQVPRDYYVCPSIGRGMEDRLYSYWAGKSEYQRTPFETLTYENWCCLHFAIHNGHQHTVKFLLENNIMPPGNLGFRATALPLAALRGHAEITKLLIAAGFDTSAILWRYTALELASKYGHTEVIKVLLDAGVPATALDLANAVSSGSLPAASLLLERGANLHGIAARTGDTARHAAVKERNKEMLEFLLKSGANVEILDYSGSTPLYRAVERHKGDAVKLLFEYGAIVEAQLQPNKPGAEKSVLHHALLNRAGELVPLLLEHGAQVETRARHGMTPFLQAGSCGSVPAIEALWVAGCHIHARDDKQRTALHHAADGHTDAVKALLRLGLDPNARDAEGKTPLHLAPYSGMSPVYHLLVRHGGDNKAVDHKVHSVGY
jgi:ankyrin repeat protein